MQTLVLTHQFLNQPDWHCKTDKFSVKLHSNGESLSLFDHQILMDVRNHFFCKRIAANTQLLDLSMVLLLACFMCCLSLHSIRSQILGIHLMQYLMHLFSTYMGLLTLKYHILCNYFVGAHLEEPLCILLCVMPWHLLRAHLLQKATMVV